MACVVLFESGVREAEEVVSANRLQRLGEAAGREGAQLGRCETIHPHVGILHVIILCILSC